jgi:hypothetical protein
MNVVADGKIRVLETVQGSRTFLPDCAFRVAPSSLAKRFGVYENIVGMRCKPQYSRYSGSAFRTQCR